MMTSKLAHAPLPPQTVYNVKKYLQYHELIKKNLNLVLNLQ